MSNNINVNTAPIAPEVVGYVDHSVSNYADAPVGGPFYDATPGIVFNSVPGETYTMYDNGGLIGTIVATKSVTNWTIPAVLANGQHELVLVASNDAGLVSPQVSIPVAIVAGPGAPRFSGLIDHTISNYADADISKPTHDVNPTLTFAGTAGNTISVFEGNHLIGTALITASTVQFTLPTMSNGIHNLSIIETSAAGISVPTHLSLTVAAPVAAPVAAHDAPATPELLGMIDHTVDNNWNFNSGELSNDPNPTVVLTAKIGDVLTVSDNGVVIGSIVATSEQMSWTLPTLADGRHSLTITESNNNGVSDPLTLKLTVYADGALVPADTTPDAPQPAADTNVHTAVGLHDAFVATGDHQTVDLNADPAAYFKQTSAHIEGGEAGVHTLHLTGSNEVLDLTSLTGKTAAAKISGIEVIDLGGHTNSVSLSIVDVLNLGQTDLFMYDGNKQMIVNGSNGDTVDLLHANVARVQEADWENHGTANVGGVEYNVYQHEGAQTELLIQQGVHVVVH
ncbi:hypothetical protein ASG35_02150 [Burkholderia sp. Leaf177]|uniref:hypothetical protein n=1 Tax=Burkholderia sp. Leaf177 TaxID=1736287 RepID=UPI0007001B1D|nr:hypothetical protein [Burkholderia sp. Leaf177]KQR90045.1 hypothetical protein ASG35_02150 [Burkholderia sp. Leaf177]